MPVPACPPCTPTLCPPGPAAPDGKNNISPHGNPKRSTHTRHRCALPAHEPGGGGGGNKQSFVLQNAAQLHAYKPQCLALIPAPNLHILAPKAQSPRHGTKHLDLSAWPRCGQHTPVPTPLHMAEPSWSPSNGSVPFPLHRPLCASTPCVPMATSALLSSCPVILHQHRSHLQASPPRFVCTFLRICRCSRSGPSCSHGPQDAGAQ